MLREQRKKTWMENTVHETAGKTQCVKTVQDHYIFHKLHKQKDL